MSPLLMMEQRDDTASEAAVKGDYFFLFDNQVDYNKAKREPRRKRLFRRFSSRRNKDWRRRRAYETAESPDTTALMSDDEHSILHSYAHDDDDDLQSLSGDHYNPNIIWPETMSLVEIEEDDDDPVVQDTCTPTSDTDKRSILSKKWKSTMRKSLRRYLAAKHKSYGEMSEGSTEPEDRDDDDDDQSTTSLLDRAKHKLGLCKSSRAKKMLYEEEIGLYVNSSDDEVETVYKSTFDQLCVPSFPDYKPGFISATGTKEARDEPPQFPETVQLDNGEGVARLLYQGNANLVVNYSTDFAQLELQSDDECSRGGDPDDDDDLSFTKDRLLPSLNTSTSEETEYNLFNQSSVEKEYYAGGACGRYESLLAATSTESEDFGAMALCAAYPLPPPTKNQQEVVLVDSSSQDPTVFLQETMTSEDYLGHSTSTSQDYSETSRRLGATRVSYSSVKEQTQTTKSSPERRLGISCAPVQMTETTLEDAAEVWKRIYAPPEQDLPSPTPVQKSRTPYWGCGLDASPLSVHSDISDSEAGAANPFYNIRRYTAPCGVEEDHPFDEVDSAPPGQPPSFGNQCAPVRTSSFAGCGGVSEMVRSNIYHRVHENRPRCECVKCSVTNMYANLLKRSEHDK